MVVKRMIEIDAVSPEIGDHISFTLKTGENIEAMAVKELPTGMVFCTIDFLNTPYPMNKNGGTDGGYDKSDLRKILNSEILDSFPDDIRKHLVPFNNGDLIMLPSERELFGWNMYAAEDEYGIWQWEAMKNMHNRVAFRMNFFESGWLRNVINSTDFVCCKSIGAAYTCRASSYLGVRPVFIIDSNMEERDD